ncbi:unnamed protein product [Echinostoma caproni]|uniref:Uncharacterized protein n=1 Tax=Echinostoma caproni TaxID=27848 RepID=A0A183ASM7_9TREM|nr:unnamed protein product [Echinostoma caproni]
MPQVKPDPDGALNTSGPFAFGKTVSSADCEVTESTTETPSTSITGSHSEKLPATRDRIAVSDESQHTDKQKSSQALRRIAPKPYQPPIVRFHSPLTTSPNLSVTHSTSFDADGFISFGGFERYIPSNNRSMDVPRAEYANTIVPHKNIHVSGRTTLRLYQVVPKSRTTIFLPQPQILLLVEDQTELFRDQYIENPRGPDGICTLGVLLQIQYRRGLVRTIFDRVIIIIVQRDTVKRTTLIAATIELGDCVPRIMWKVS